MGPEQFKNLIQERFVRRAANLLAAFEAANSIQHDSTRGEVRESALRDSLLPLAPPNLSVHTGFVLDAYGEITPQLDIIFARHESLSPVLLEGGTALVPIETFALSVEVKSTLKTGHLNKQIKEQATSLQKMKHTGVVPDAKGNCYKLLQTLTPMCIVAYETDVALDTLNRFVKDHPVVQGVTVLTGDRKCSIVHGHEPRTDLTELQLVLSFWSLVFHMGIARNRRPQLGPEHYAQLEKERMKFRPDLSQEWFNELILTPSLSAYLEPPTPPKEGT